MGSSSCQHPGMPSYLRADIPHGLIIVAMDRPIEGLDIDTVTVDNEFGAREAVHRLLAAGHRRVAAVPGDVRIWTSARRLDGYRAALADIGQVVDEALISTAHGALEAQAALQVMLALEDPPTAVFAGQHWVGRGAMRAMHNAGTPMDLAVFDGVDDNDLLITLRWLSPHLVQNGSGSSPPSCWSTGWEACGMSLGTPCWHRCCSARASAGSGVRARSSESSCRRLRHLPTLAHISTGRSTSTRRMDSSPPSALAAGPAGRSRSPAERKIKGHSKEARRTTRGRVPHLEPTSRPTPWRQSNDQHRSSDDLELIETPTLPRPCRRSKRDRSSSHSARSAPCAASPSRLSRDR